LKDLKLTQKEEVRMDIRFMISVITMHPEVMTVGELKALLEKQEKELTEDINRDFQRSENVE